MDEHIINLLLPEGLRPHAFGDGKQLSIRTGVIQKARISKLVVNNTIGAFEQFQAADRNQVRPTRPGANQINFTFSIRHIHKIRNDCIISLWAVEYNP